MATSSPAASPCCSAGTSCCCDRRRVMSAASPAMSGKPDGNGARATVLPGNACPCALALFVKRNSCLRCVQTSRGGVIRSATWHVARGSPPGDVAAPGSPPRRPDGAGGERSAAQGDEHADPRILAAQRFQGEGDQGPLRPPSGRPGRARVSGKHPHRARTDSRSPKSLGAGVQELALPAHSSRENPRFTIGSRRIKVVFLSCEAEAGSTKHMVHIHVGRTRTHTLNDELKW